MFIDLACSLEQFLSDGLKPMNTVFMGFFLEQLTRFSFCKINADLE